MDLRLSKEQQRALAIIERHGGIVSRAKLGEQKVFQDTIRALVRRGLVEETLNSVFVKLAEKGDA